MSDSKTAAGPTLACPACGYKGNKVKLVTLQSLLKPDVASSSIGGGPYRFCDSIDCETVYFADDGRTFEKDDLTVRVGVKERTPPRHVCYCFDHTIEEIDDEVRQTGKSTVLDDIKTRMKGGCWCETKSPQGACCLSTVGKYVKESLATHGSDKSADVIEEVEENYSSTGGHGSEEAEEDCCGPGGHSSQAIAGMAGGSNRRRKWNVRATAQIGTVVSAVLASACCWLPLLLIAFGVSGVAVSATLAEYRPLFVSLTFIFLAAAFYFTYRPRLAAAETNRSGDCCEVTDDNESCCPAKGAERFGIQKLNKAILWVVTVIALAFVFFPNYIGGLIGGSNPAVASRTVDTIVVQVDGMTCEGCAATLDEALRAVPGVKSTQVDYAKGQAVVGILGGNAFPHEAVLAAIANAGFKGSFSGEIEKRILIDGMTCGACAVHVRSNLENVPGVKSASVSYAEKTASVVLGPNGPSDELLKKAVEAAGHRVVSVEQ